MTSAMFKCIFPSFASSSPLSHCRCFPYPEESNWRIFHNWTFSFCFLHHLFFLHRPKQCHKPLFRCLNFDLSCWCLFKLLNASFPVALFSLYFLSKQMSPQTTFSLSIFTQLSCSRFSISINSLSNISSHKLRFATPDEDNSRQAKGFEKGERKGMRKAKEEEEEL